MAHGLEFTVSYSFSKLTCKFQAQAQAQAASCKIAVSWGEGGQAKSSPGSHAPRPVALTCRADKNGFFGFLFQEKILKSGL
jgi:hypothetical protein